MQLTFFEHIGISFRKKSTLVGGVFIASVVFSILSSPEEQLDRNDLLFTEQLKKEMPEEAQKFLRINQFDYSEVEEQGGILIIKHNSQVLFSLKKVLDNRGDIYAWELLSSEGKGIWIFSDNTVQSIFVFHKRRQI